MHKRKHKHKRKGWPEWKQNLMQTQAQAKSAKPSKLFQVQDNLDLLFSLAKQLTMHV